MKKMPTRVKIQNVIISKSLLFSIFSNINIKQWKNKLLDLKDTEINLKNKEANLLPKKVKELILRSYMFAKGDREKASYLFFKKISQVNQSGSYKEFYD